VVESAFVDTTFWYDFFNEGAGDHGRVKSEYAQFPGPLVTTSYVVAETVSLLCKRRGRHLAGRFLQHLQRSKRCTVFHPNEEMFDRAVVTFHQRENQLKLDLVDIISFVWMGAAGVRTALTKDGHFTMEGFTVLPPVTGS